MNKQTCPTCQITFEKATEFKALQALRMHCRFVHKVELPKEAAPETPPATVRVFKPREKGSIVKWDATEIEQIVEASAEIRLSHPVDSLLDCIRAAIETLPEHRRRHIPTIGLLPPGLQQKILLRIDTKRKGQIPEPEQIIQTLTVEIPVEKPATQTAGELPTAILMAELFGRIITRLDRLEHALASKAGHNGHTNGKHHHDPAPAAPVPIVIPKRPVPRIAIVGLLRDQFEHAKDKLKNTEAEYMFIDKDKSDTTIPRVDCVICERHLQHRWATNARAELGNDRVLFADGISTVVQRALDFLSRKPKLAVVA